MLSARWTKAARTLAMTAMVTFALSGCGQTSDWIKGRSATESYDPAVVGASELDIYISELGKIASGDPAAQAEIYADAAAAAQLTPGASTNLRLGLVLAIPGHPESDPERAQSILREVLAQTILLTPGEISLATIHLNSVERQTVANSEARQERLSGSRIAKTREQALNQQLTATEAENRELRQGLAEAEQKLEAITSIERSIREQE
jgi:hypothetical protein